VEQPCAPQFRDNPILLFAFIFFAFAHLTVSSGRYRCSEHNIHWWRLIAGKGDDWLKVEDGRGKRVLKGFSGLWGGVNAAQQPAVGGRDVEEALFEQRRGAGRDEGDCVAVSETSEVPDSALGIAKKWIPPQVGSNRL